MRSDYINEWNPIKLCHNVKKTKKQNKNILVSASEIVSSEMISKVQIDTDQNVLVQTK